MSPQVGLAVIWNVTKCKILLKLPIMAARMPKDAQEHAQAQEPGRSRNLQLRPNNQIIHNRELASHIVAKWTDAVDTLDEDRAAARIQRCMTRRYLGNNVVFQRAYLLQRIVLELKLMRGLRLLF